MILLAVQQSMETKAREAARIPDHNRFWDVHETIKVFFANGKSIDRSNALMAAGIAHNYALFADTTIHPSRRGQIRFLGNGESQILATAYDETEFGLWLMKFKYIHNLTREDAERLAWVMLAQESWDNQQHNGNMFLMRKMLTM